MHVIDTPKRILVVDDDPGVCDTLATIISAGTRHHVEPFTDPLAALEHTRRTPCHLVLTDIVMPKMDGLTLLKELKSLNPHLEVIVLTAYGSADNAVSALRDRAYDFIQKPFTASRVLEALTEALLRQQATEALNRTLEACSATNMELKRRARHQLSLVSSIDRASMARVIFRITGKSLKGRVDEIRDGTVAIDRTMRSGATLEETRAQLAQLKGAVDALRLDLEEMATHAPEPPLAPRATDLVDLVTARAREFFEYFPEALLQLDVPTEPVKLEIDAEAMGLALFNVLLNAVQATGGAGTVRVSLTVSAGNVEITVQDTGLGFTSLGLARAAQPFFTTKGSPFAGLGLTLAKHVMDEHRGNLVIANGAKGGAMVVLRLPRWR